eukprot:CAMPEP_0180212580 /NCGR_PEP_ID=MMETSP0987-20121128/13581_1 /TAXON_ID=697907 /ORGANISM="non described non described, Strain CCMP2293" /LENGTH=94 /DNA_ID=CAMNT_0022170267 /DNA_START=291 /DNA_END=575 /DNA_ORIENTATION=-
MKIADGAAIGGLYVARHMHPFARNATSPRVPARQCINRGVAETPTYLTPPSVIPTFHMGPWSVNVLYMSSYSTRVTLNPVVAAMHRAAGLNAAP